MLLFCFKQLFYDIIIMKGESVMDRKAIKAKAKEFAFCHKWAIWKPVLLVSIILIS